MSKFWQNASFIKKVGKLRDVENHSITTRIFAVTYCYTLEVAIWPLGMKNPKSNQNFQKTWIKL